MKLWQDHIPRTSMLRNSSLYFEQLIGQKHVNEKNYRAELVIWVSPPPGRQ